MKEDGVQYVGVIWPSQVSHKQVQDEITRCFGQAIDRDFLDTASGRKCRDTKTAQANASPDDVLIVLTWVFAGLGFLRSTPEALAILQEWLQESNLREALAFTAAHRDVVDRLVEFCTRFGCQVQFRAVKEVPEDAATKTKRAVSDKGRERMELARDMDALMKKKKRAQAKGDTPQTRKLCNEIQKLQKKSFGLLAKGPAMIAT